MNQGWNFKNLNRLLAANGTGYFTACASGSTVTFTSINGGPSTDWSISASDADTTPTYQCTSNPCTRSFSATHPSSGCVTGGGRWPRHEITENPLCPIHPQFYFIVDEWVTAKPNQLLAAWPATMIP